jgi:beta-lactamase class A
MQLGGAVCVVGLVCFVGDAVVSRAAPPPAVPRTAPTPAAIPVAVPVTAAAGDVFADPAVSAYLASTTGDVTAAVYDGVTGQTALFRPGVAEDTASIMKVDILATLLDKSQSGGDALTATEQQLSQDMIEQSDNQDAQDLWDAEGGAPVVQLFDAEAGLTQTVPDAAGYWGLSTTTAADQVKLLRALAYPNDILTAASRSYELELMSDVEPSQAWGVSAGVPDGVAVALKNGWLPLAGGWQVNSVGYVHGDGRDYVIAVLTDGNATESQGIDTIESLSSLVWSALAPGS